MVVPTCRALPLVSMGSVTAEMAQMMHTEEKRHRAPKKEALISTCRLKNIKQELAGVGGWHLISKKEWTKGHKYPRDSTIEKTVSCEP